jgi:hypothetical protein
VQPDNRIRLTYLSLNAFPIQCGTTTVDVTVTPVITDFGLNSGILNVVSVGGQTVGITSAGIPNNAQILGGANLHATVDAHNLPGNAPPGTDQKGLVFIQNAGIPNGAAAVQNGAAGLLHGFVSTAAPFGVDAQLVGPGGALLTQVLDMPGQTQPPPPDYANINTVPVAGSLTITAIDSPGVGLGPGFTTGNPPAVVVPFIGGLTDIAVRFNFRMYLVWRYPSRGQGTVTYTIGTLDWTVYFRATGVQPLAVSGPPLVDIAEAPHAIGTFDPNNHNNPIVVAPTFNPPTLQTN